MIVVKTAQTKIASPIAFEPKKDGPLSIFVDYKSHNANTLRYSYPIPHMD